MRTMIVATVLTGLIATPVMAQPPVSTQPPMSVARPAGPPAEHPRGDMMEMELGPTMILKMREALNLTDIQVTQLRTLEDSTNLSVHPHMTKHMQGMHDATALLDVATPDLAAYDARVREATDHMLLAHTALARIELQSRLVLTPEQRVQLVAARKTSHELREGAMKHGPMKDPMKKDGVPPTTPPRP